MAAFASRYARAFADVVTAHRLDVAKVTAELNSFVTMIEQTPELLNVWTNPSVPEDQRIKLLDAIVAREGVSKQTRNFIAVLIGHRRIASIADIARSFQTEMDERMGFAEAEITSARELGDDERSTLEAQVSQLTGKRVRAVYKRDAALIGGAVVRVGSTIYDGSVRGELERMKQELVAAQ
jgi:F-type H+-transporting ATPase subunit delta